MPPVLLQSAPVDGPGDRHVRVLFYDDGSVRVRISNAAPMKLSEAFLRGKGDHVIIKLDPEISVHSAGHSLLVREPETERAETIELLRNDDSIGVVERAKRIANQLSEETLRFRTDGRANGAVFGTRVQHETEVDRVVTAVFDALGGRMHEFTALGSALVEYGPEQCFQLGNGLARLFRTPVADGYVTLSDVPRFVSVITAMVLLGYAVALRQYKAFAEIAIPEYLNDERALPWAITEQFHHLDSMGRRGDWAGLAAIEFAKAEPLAQIGLTLEDLQRGMLSAQMLLVICATAYLKPGNAPFPWAIQGARTDLRSAIRDIATDRNASAALGQLTNESGDEFRAAFVGRYGALVDYARRVNSGISTPALSADMVALFSS